MVEEELEDLLEEKENVPEEELEDEQSFVDNLSSSILGGHVSALVLEQEFSSENVSVDLENLVPRESTKGRESENVYEMSTSYEIESSKDVRYEQAPVITAPVLGNVSSINLGNNVNRDLFVERDSNLRGGQASNEFEAFEEQQKKYEAERHEEGLPFRRERRDRDISFI